MFVGIFPAMNAARAEQAHSSLAAQPRAGRV